MSISQNVFDSVVAILLCRSNGIPRCARNQVNITLRFKLYSYNLSAPPLLYQDYSIGLSSLREKLNTQ